MHTLSIKEAAALAQVSRRTIYHWLRADKLQYLRTAGGAVRIVPASLYRAGNVPVPTSTGGAQ
jgi:excisionase family DNA binding protein